MYMCENEKCESSIVLKTNNHEPKIFIIETTQLCNMKCPWCIAKSFRPTFGNIDNTTEWTKEVKDIFEKHIETHIYDRYVMTGGEPLLFLDRIKWISDKVRSINPNSKLRICSNATLLNPEIIKFINDYGIQFVTSCQGYGDDIKSVNHLLSYNKNIIKYINSIDNIFVRYVFLSGNKNIFKNIMYMKELFPKSDVNITMDTSKEVHFTIEDFIEYRNLLKEAKDNNIYIDVASINDDFCHCWLKEHKFRSIGTFDYGRSMDTNCIMGCSKTFKCFGPIQYELYRNISSLFFKTNRWDRKVYKLEDNFKIKDSVFDHASHDIKLNEKTGKIFIQ